MNAVLKTFLWFNVLTSAYAAWFKYQLMQEKIKCYSCEFALFTPEISFMIALVGVAVSLMMLFLYRNNTNLFRLLALTCGIGGVFFITLMVSFNQICYPCVLADTGFIATAVLTAATTLQKKGDVKDGVRPSHF